MPEATNDTPRPIAEISQAPNALEQFLDRNQRNLIIFSILVVIGVCAYIVHNHIKDAAEKDAGTALLNANDITALVSAAKSHSGTAAGATASLLLADKQWNDGQQDAAIETLRSFIAANPSHPGKPTAQASLGARLMFQGKSAEAQSALQSVVDNPEARFLAPYALTLLGDMAKNAGDLTKAESLYKQASKEYAGNYFAQQAGKHLEMLKTKAPVEIPAPPKAATPKEPTPDEDVPPVSLVPQDSASNPLMPPAAEEPAAPEPNLPAPPPVPPTNPKPATPADNGKAPQ
jgi:predicted negative regulator of RcsB-dependent stress response